MKLKFQSTKVDSFQLEYVKRHAEQDGDNGFIQKCVNEARFGKNRPKKALKIRFFHVFHQILSKKPKKSRIFANFIWNHYYYRVQRSFLHRLTAEYRSIFIMRVKFKNTKLYPRRGSYLGPFALQASALPLHYNTTKNTPLIAHISIHI